MGDFRIIIADARRDLHETLKVPALYIERPGFAPQLVYLRIQRKDALLGRILGAGVSGRAFAETYDSTIKLVFMLEEVYPRVGATVSVAPGEAYYVDSVLPPDIIQVAAEATRVDRSECINLPVPEGYYAG